MLDEGEFALIVLLHNESRLAIKDFRRTHQTSLKDTPLQELYKPVCVEYERITGRKEMNHDEILKHRISLYGPPCKHCKKPLRTPKAKLCGACMQPVQAEGN
ncbi:MAG: hypothetical protein WAN35_14505 [Terracidiphilus sp.]